MSAASVIGWMIIGVVVAIGICKKQSSKSGSVQNESGCEITKVSTDDEDVICETLENIMGCRAFIFDFGLKLIGLGGQAKGFVRPETQALHLIDIVPAEITHLFLDGAAAVRRGDARTWRCRWNESDVDVRTAPLGKNKIVIVVTEATI